MKTSPSPENTPTPDASPASTPDAAASSFSLQRLSSAFARLMGAGEAEPSAGSAAEPEEEQEDDDDSQRVSLRHVTPRKIVEAMLFVGAEDGHPLTAAEMAAGIRDVPPTEVESLIEELNATYVAHDAACDIVAIGGGYRMQLRPDLHRHRLRLQGRLKAARLSAAALETLSVAAYRPGVTLDEMDRLRGSKSGVVLSQLVRRQLLRVERDSGEGSAPTRYFPTPRFDRLVGIQTLGDLPRTGEFEDLGEFDEKT